MKKLLLTTLASSAILLAACSDSPEVASTEAGRIRQDDLYAEMKDEPLQGGMTVGETVLQKMLLEDVFEHLYGDQVTEEDVDAEFTAAAEQFGTVEEYEQLLEQQGIGVDFVKDNIRLTQLMETAVRDNVEITDEQVEEEYEANRPFATAQHILVEDEETANDIIAQLEDGADFAELVEEHSIDPGSVDNEGKYTFNEGEMVPPFEEAVGNLEPGETTSEPVETQNGFHVIRRLETEYAPLEEQREEVEDSIVQGYMQDPQFMANLITDLSAEANVQISDEDLQGAMAMYMPQEEQTPEGESEDEAPAEDGTEAPAEEGGEETEEAPAEEETTEEESTEEESAE
jgi:foldase protein PrsA